MWKKSLGLFVLSLFIGLTMAMVAQAQSPTTATAELKDTTGKVVGNATLTEVSNGVRVVAQISGLTSVTREHGIHIHTVGQCTPDFSAAGGHFNPTGKKHGLKNPEGSHVGDLPNLMLNADGTASYEGVAQDATLSSGANSLLDADGSALVIHASIDDEMTDPAGNSGGRIACGVIMSASGMVTSTAVTQTVTSATTQTTTTTTTQTTLATEVVPSPSPTAMAVPTATPAPAKPAELPRTGEDNHLLDALLTIGVALLIGGVGLRYVRLPA